MAEEKIGQASPDLPARTTHSFDYYPHLDGLRAIAVFLVMVWHFLPYDNLLRDSYRWGWFGVRMFFVLSGFLITGILLREKRPEAKIASVLYSFYARRALRIFPLYYAYIVLLLVATKEMASYFPWFASYLHNILMFNQESISAIPGASILWTLAIEEQFYLIWPLVLLLTPIQQIPKVMVVCIVCGVVTRFILRFFFGYLPGVAMVFPTSNIDSLVMGSLLAYGRLYSPNQDALTRLLNVCGVTGFLFIVLQFLLWNFAEIRLQDDTAGKINFVVADFFAALFFVFVIDRAARQETGYASIILGNSWAAGIGRISYGIYVLHMFSGQLVWRLAGKAGFSEPERSVVLFFPCIVVSIFAAFISWKFFENPINRLKRLFPYPRG